MLKIFEKNKSDNFICIGTLFSNPFNSICYLPLDNNGNNFFKENPFDININNLDQLNMFQFIQKKGQEKMNYYNNLINSFIMIESNIDIDFIINLIDEKDKKKFIEFINNLEKAIKEMKEKLNQVNNLKKQIELGIRTQEKMIIDIQNKKDDINFFNESLIKFQNEIIISYNNMTMVEGLLKEIKDLSMKIYKDKHNLPSMIKYNCKEDTTLTKLGQELYNKINDQTSNIKKCINEQEKIFLEFEKN